MLRVTIPAEKLIPHLQGGNRVTGYKVTVRQGLLCGILKIPDDWWIRVEPVMERYQINASAGHGASYLPIRDISAGAFDNFIIIKAFPKDGPLKIEIEFSIDIPMEEEERLVAMTENDVSLAPVAHGAY